MYTICQSLSFSKFENIIEKLITILSFFHIHETGIPCSLLESEGVECFIRNENTVAYTPIVVSGIELQVKESDVPRAMKILKDGGFIKGTESTSGE